MYSLPMQEDTYLYFGLMASEYGSAVYREEWIRRPIAETVGVFIYILRGIQFRHCFILEERAD